MIERQGDRSTTVTDRSVILGSDVTLVEQPINALGVNCFAAKDADFIVRDDDLAFVV